MAAAAHAPPDQHLSGPPAPQTPAAARRPPAWYEEACSPQACSAPAAPQPSPAGTSNTHAAPIAAPDEIRLPRPAPRPAEPCGVRCLRSSSPAHATSGLPSIEDLSAQEARVINLHSSSSSCSSIYSHFTQLGVKKKRPLRSATPDDARGRRGR